ncbi:MAG: ytvI [Caloramator sp.]|jgi:sporulation integral membrane protein YtvI|uniref:sporulation integral membrane protein YtvI n=1 Tax=Caloramator sp. TaxID=1871330 RepID=UPI001D8CE92E|nr:sporulation integral membrane protein YtvI [Caloramator sp.]MBZ4662531.1 ytvI [Caloramator sp.]
MFDKQFLIKLRNFAIFIVIYTLVFFLFFSTLSYTLPFVIGIIVSLISLPLVKFLKHKLKFKDSIASLISVLLVYIIFVLLLIGIFTKITYEIKQLVSSIPNVNTFIPYIQEYFDKLRLYYDAIDPAIVQKINDQITKFAYSSLDISLSILNKLLSIILKLPVIFLVLFVSLLSSYFFSKDMLNFRSSILNIFTPDGKKKFSLIIDELNKSLTGYIKAYSFIVTLSFVETYIGFSVLNIKYALILSIVSAIFDVLPILGIGAVYSLVALYYIITKKYIIAFGIIILYLIVTVVRQILEPKLVSASLGLHPVAVLAAIFIGIKAYGFVGMIYLIFLMVLYNILKKTKIL